MTSDVKFHTMRTISKIKLTFKNDGFRRHQDKTSAITENTIYREYDNNRIDTSSRLHSLELLPLKWHHKLSQIMHPSSWCMIEVSTGKER